MVWFVEWSLCRARSWTQLSSCVPCDTGYSMILCNLLQKKEIRTWALCCNPNPVLVQSWHRLLCTAIKILTENTYINSTEDKESSTFYRFSYSWPFLNHTIELGNISMSPLYVCFTHFNELSVPVPPLQAHSLTHSGVCCNICLLSCLPSSPHLSAFFSLNSNPYSAAGQFFHAKKGTVPSQGPCADDYNLRELTPTTTTTWRVLTPQKNSLTKLRRLHRTKKMILDSILVCISSWPYHKLYFIVT